MLDFDSWRTRGELWVSSSAPTCLALFSPRIPPTAYWQTGMMRLMRKEWKIIVRHYWMFQIPWKEGFVQGISNIFNRKSSIFIQEPYCIHYHQNAEPFSCINGTYASPPAQAWKLIFCYFLLLGIQSWFHFAGSLEISYLFNLSWGILCYF